MKYVFLAIAALFLAACEPAIGDSCTYSSDCPPGSVCDVASPSGYCLISGCEYLDDCPQGSVCVTFDAAMSFCMDKCKKNSDCRDGYACRTDLGTVPFCYVAPNPDKPYAQAEN